MPPPRGRVFHTINSNNGTNADELPQLTWPQAANWTLDANFLNAGRSRNSFAESMSDFWLVEAIIALPGVEL